MWAIWLVLGGCSAPDPPMPIPPPAPLPDPDAGDPGTLRQTDERPLAGDPAFLARAQRVVDALGGAEPSVADPAFFPLSAYLQVKELPKPADPEQDWNTRLMGAFHADLRALATPGRGRVLRVEAPDDRVTWVAPGEEHNKIGYWRILGAALVWESDGIERRERVKTMISWRGQWYLVHLR